MLMKAKIPKNLKKPRNFVAKDLMTPKYSMKVEKSNEIFYNRASEKSKLSKNYRFYAN
jgi:hypothetical protein